MTRLPFILADLESAIDALLPQPRQRMIVVALEREAFAAVSSALTDHYGWSSEGDDSIVHIGQIAVLPGDKLRFEGANIKITRRD